MKNGKNIWNCHKCGNQFTSEEDECPFCLTRNYTIPAYPASRIKGDKFQHYTGQSIWEKQANKAMKDIAQSNFERKNQR